MNPKIIAKIDSLPPLPQTAVEIDAFKNKTDKNPQELVKIVEKDPLIVSTLLKVSNSAMFGFKKRIENPQMAVSLLGVNFTVSLALGSAVKNCVQTSLEPYGVGTDAFLDNAALSSSFAAKWVVKVDASLQNRLILPAFLLKTGKFVISMALQEEGKTQAFKNEILSCVETDKVEEKFVATSTPLVTAAIFKHWELDERLISDLENIQHIFTDTQNDLTVSKMLYILNIVCNISNPLSDASIAYALESAKNLGLDTAVLQNVIDSVKESIAM
jgi:HD-like signal output (HDOD) protein